MPKKIQYAVAAGAVVLLLLFFGCRREKIELVEGFRLVRMNRDVVQLVDSRNGDFPVVSGNVERYAVSAPFIVGYASANHLNLGTNAAVGYFMLKADSREFQQGMSEERWRQLMHKIHWGDPPLQPVP